MGRLIGRRCMGRCWGGRGILEGGEENWIVWEHTAGNGVAKGEGGRGDSQRESIFEAQGTEGRCWIWIHGICALG
jgi:hypothetical protein